MIIDFGWIVIILGAASLYIAEFVGVERVIVNTRLLFKPTEIKHLFSEIDFLKSTAINTTDNTSTAFYEFESKIKVLEIESKNAILQNSNSLAKKVKQNGKTIFEIASNIMLNECRAQLTTGENHLYRGFLSRNGEIYQEIFDLILAELEKRNLLSKQEKSSIKKEVQLEVDKTG